VKEPRRLQLVGAAPQAAAELPEWPVVPVTTPCIALTEIGGRGEALLFAQALAEAWCALGRPPHVVFCELDATPRITAEEAARFAIATQALRFVPIRSREEWVALVAQTEARREPSPTLFVGDLAVHALGRILKVVIARAGDPLAMTSRARALQASSSLVLSSARPGLARLLAEGLGGPTLAP